MNSQYAQGMPRQPKPGGAVFEPRKFAENRRKFGASSARLTFGPMETPQQGAAELQHALANRIREHLLDENTNLKALSETENLPPGLNYDRFQRIARGETMLSLTDLMFWATRILNFGDFVGETISNLVSEGKIETE